MSNIISTTCIQTLEVGDNATDEDEVEYCITNVENEKSIGDGQIQTDNNFIIVTLKIINNGKQPYSVSSYDFLLVHDKNKYEFDKDGLGYFKNSMFYDTINPNISKEYVLVYEMPMA